MLMSLLVAEFSLFVSKLTSCVAVGVSCFCFPDNRHCSCSALLAFAMAVLGLLAPLHAEYRLTESVDVRTRVTFKRLGSVEDCLVRVSRAERLAARLLRQRFQRCA